LKKVLEKGFSLLRCLVRELWGRVVPFTGIFEKKWKEGSGNGPYLYGSSVRGTWRAVLDW
jgi:hypothetical protein